VLPAALLLAVIIVGDDRAFDFRQFWQGGRDVLDGVSPYPSAAAVESAEDDLDPQGIQDVFRFPYPAGAAVATAPLAWLPFEAAAWVVVVGSVAAFAVALRLLDVRDWRCYGAAFGSIAVIGAVRLGTLTPLLALLLAAMWRWRDRRFVVGAALAAAVALKVFLWPLAVWLLATRRFAAAALAAAGAATTTVLAWAALGFDGLAVYPDLVRRLVDVVGGRGYSLVALGLDLGLPAGVADTLPWLAGVALLAATVLLARGSDGDRRAFAAALAAGVLMTPIVWLHYLALVYVPIALWRRTLAAAWLVPLALWLTPYQETGGEAWRVAAGLAIGAAALALAVGRPGRRQAAA